MPRIISPALMPRATRCRPWTPRTWTHDARSQTTGIVTLLSGTPFTIYASGDRSRTTVRPYADYLPGCDASAHVGSDPRLGWFNTACFQDTAIGTWGTVGRNTLRGPGLAVVDW